MAASNPPVARPSGGKGAAVDPFTLTVIQSSLPAIGDEMFAAMRKTAMSAIIYEVLDMGTGITDAAGELAASGCGIPTFMAVIDKAVKRILELRGKNGVRPGDMFITNDPDYGGVTHLNDVVLLLPVFAGKHLVAWTGNIAHWPDLGGMVPGSMSSASNDIWQEGLRLTAVKLFEDGKPIQSVFDILMANTRLPENLRGDMWAGIAAVRVGERRILDMVKKYGRATFEAALDDYMRQGEQASLIGLRDLPHGVFERAELQENGATWKARIEIRPDAFVVDIRDNPDQSSLPFNLSRDGAVIAAQMIFKNVTGPNTACNGGAFRPLTVLTRPGSIFEPKQPAPHGFYFEVRMRLFDMLWRCLAEVMPDRLPAGHYASICSTTLSGIHPDTGRPYAIIEPQLGGWGACADRDGISANFAGGHGDTFNCPAEIAEARYGVAVEKLGLNDTQGGEGRFRGGRGIEARYRVRAPEAFLTIGYGRSKIPPWGIAGGSSGTPNYVEVVRGDGSRERLAVATHLPLHKGDLLRIVTGNGGGYGDPKARDAGAIRHDLRDGYLTPERAREVYGFVPEPARAAE